MSGCTAGHRSHHLTHLLYRPAVWKCKRRFILGTGSWRDYRYQDPPAQLALGLLFPVCHLGPVIPLAWGKKRWSLPFWVCRVSLGHTSLCRSLFHVFSANERQWDSGNHYNSPEALLSYFLRVHEWYFRHLHKAKSLLMWSSGTSRGLGVFVNVLHALLTYYFDTLISSPVPHLLKRACPCPQDTWICHIHYPDWLVEESRLLVPATWLA